MRAFATAPIVVVMNHNIETRHGRMAVEITPSPRTSAPPIVVLHSGGHDRSDFDAITPALARDHEVIAMDLLGHGDSDMFSPPSSASARRIAEGALDAVAALARPPAILVGNSVGGTCALTVAIERPDLVRALVLVSTSGLVERTLLVRGFCWVQGREVVRRRTGMAFARHYLKRRNEHTARLLDRMRTARRRDDFIAMEAALWRSFGDPSSSVFDRIDAVRCPVLFVWGERDPVLRAAVEGARARAALPHATWMDMDCGHVPFVEDPDGFLDATRAFLAATRAPDARADATSAPA